MAECFHFRKKRAALGTGKLKLGSSVGLLNFLMSFCFFFCLLLFLYFNRYQADLERSLIGEADFQPEVYLGSITGFYLLHWIFCRVKKAWVMALADLAVVLCFCLLLPVRNERYLLGLALLFYVLTDCVQLGKLASRDDREMEIHFLGKSNFYWGVGILILMMGHFITARHGEIGLPCSSMVCTGWMLGTFFVYLILFMFQRYQYMFYHYFYKRKSIDQAVYGQTRKVLAFVLLVTGIAVGIVFTVVSLLTKLFNHGCLQLSKHWLKWLPLWGFRWGIQNMLPGLTVVEAGLRRF